MRSFRFNVFNFPATRVVAARPPRRALPLARLPFVQPTHFPAASAARAFTNSAARAKDPPKEEARQPGDRGDDLKPENVKRARSPVPEKSTLRKVAVEAQRKRMRATSSIPASDETRKVTAYCAAERYNIFDVSRLVRAEGFELDPFQTGLYPQVVHIPINNALESKETGDIFIFPSGTLVAWNVPERISYRLVTKTLVPAAEGSHLRDMETEDLAYVEDPHKSTSDVSGDTIILGTGTPEHDSFRPSSSNDGQSGSNYEVDTVLAKIAFSSGLARSTKLAVLEGLLNNYFESTRNIPTVLSKGNRLKYKRKFILAKTGELLNIRAQLNLYSELTDALPDIFWDSRHELGLEDYYTKVGRALDVFVRIRSLNDKLTYAQEIAQVLTDRLEEKHGHFLEWIIIYLIFFEILLELNRHWKEWDEAADPESTVNLLRLYLEEELSKEKRNGDAASDALES